MNRPLGPAADLAEVLQRVEIIFQSLMDSPAPILANGSCALCTAVVDQAEHFPDCGWVVARSGISSADLSAVRHLARAVYYEPRR